MGTVSHDVAVDEFNRFADEMDLDVSTDDLGEEEREELASIKNEFVRAVKSGNLVVTDEGLPVYSLKSPVKMGEVTVEQLTFDEPTGATYMAADRRKAKQHMSKFFAMIGDMTKQEPAVFSKMKQRDLRVVKAITQLFIG